MSVSLMIDNPLNDDEEKYNLPISTEEIYTKYWAPIIEKLNLKYAKWFQTGIVISINELPTVLDELQQIRPYFEADSENQYKDYLLKRLDNLYMKLNELFNERQDIKIWIG